MREMKQNQHDATKTLSVKCPHFGHEFALPFNPIEQQIYHSVRRLARHSGAATSQAIALDVSLSQSQAVRYLNKLEQTGCITRIGMRGGWKAA